MYIAGRFPSGALAGLLGTTPRVHLLLIIPVVKYEREWRAMSVTTHLTRRGTSSRRDPLWNHGAKGCMAEKT